MGLLDDAIREHLELKRRHGASDEEIEQEEAEALGPARRDFPQPAAAEEVQSAEVQSAEGEGVFDDGAPADAEPPPPDEPPVPLGKETLAETVIDEPPPLEPEAEPEPDPEPEPESDLRPPTSDPEPEPTEEEPPHD